MAAFPAYFCNRFSYRAALPFAFVLTLLCASAPDARGQVRFTTDQETFLSVGELQYQNFTETVISVPPGSVIQCLPPVNSQGGDGCFLPGAILPGIELTSFPDVSLGSLAVLGVGGNPPAALIVNQFDNSLDVDFTDSEITTVGIRPVCIGSGFFCNTDITLTLRVFGESGFLGEASIPATIDFSGFVGVWSSERIVRIAIVDSDPEASVPGLLELWFGELPATEVSEIPTLSEWGMIAAAAGFALVGMFYAMRRRKASA